MLDADCVGLPRFQVDNASPLARTYAEEAVATCLVALIVHHHFAVNVEDSSTSNTQAEDILATFFWRDEPLHLAVPCRTRQRGMLVIHKKNLGAAKVNRVNGASIGIAGWLEVYSHCYSGSAVFGLDESASGE